MTTTTRTPPLPRPVSTILRTAEAMTDRQLMALGSAWLRVFPSGYPPSTMLDFLAPAWRVIDRDKYGHGSTHGTIYSRVQTRARRVGDRCAASRPQPPAKVHWANCIAIAIEAACLTAGLADHYGPGDALTTDLLKISAAWRRVAGDEPLLSRLNTPKEA